MKEREGATTKILIRCLDHDLGILFKETSHLLLFYVSFFIIELYGKTDAVAFVFKVI